MEQSRELFSDIRERSGASNAVVQSKIRDKHESSLTLRVALNKSLR